MSTPCPTSREQDELHCPRCGLRWSVAEPRPAYCGRPIDGSLGRRTLDQIKRSLSNP